MTRDELIEQHMHLPKYLARRLLRLNKLAGMDYEDAVGWGYYALVRAAAGFDAARGVKFSTYACRSIFYEIRQQVYRGAGVSQGEEDIPEQMHRARTPTMGDLDAAIPDTRAADAVDARDAWDVYTQDLTDLEYEALLAHLEERGPLEVQAKYNLTRGGVHVAKNRAMKKIHERRKKHHGSANGAALCS